MAFNLRKRTHFSYYESKEPSFDEYIYCERCADFVYDYCAIHGPLLVIPDNKVPVKSDISPYVPRAALTIPEVFLHLAPSIIPGAGVGVFSTLTLPRGVRFGPYCGQRTQRVDSMYCWQILDSNNKRLHVVDASDQERSNWMRYVNCARHYKEQNLVAYQYRGQLYYRTIKIIPRHTELMVFYGSEFANELDINLKQYNSAKYYKEIIISTSTKYLRDNIYGMQEDYLPEDQFHFIDKDSSETNIFGSEIDDSFLEGKEHKENNIKKECKENTPKKVRKENEIRTDSKEITAKTYVCKTCQKTYSYSRTLNKHALSHLTTWKYSCEYCSYKCNEKYRLKKHVGQHTNTYRFSCETCPFKTNYTSNFKNHSLRHEDSEKLLNNFSIIKTCDVCNFKTNSSKSYLIHMSKHKGEIYKCDKCSYSSNLKYNLYRHIKTRCH